MGIPTVLDRLIQQALLQVLQAEFEPEFSEHSYGFRPGRNAWQAVQSAQGYIREDRRWVVDLDLEKFFDRVNHDMLMSRVARRVKDDRVLKLIRRYLEAGMMSEGIVSARTEGTSYFRLTEVKGVLQDLDGWIRRKLRCLLWRQWKRPATRNKRLQARGLDGTRAWKSTSNGHGPWWNAGASHMNAAYPKRFFDALGLVSLLDTQRRFQHV